MSGNMASLVITIAGISFAVYRSIKNRNPSDLLFLPFWLFMGWMLFVGSSSASGVIAAILMLAAVAGRTYFMRKAQKRQLAELAVFAADPSDGKDRDTVTGKPSAEEWERIVGPLRDARINEYLWGYLYRLRHWIYIDLAPLMSAGTQPYCGVMGGKPSLLFFTSLKLAEEFIDAQKIRDSHESAAIVSFVMPGMLSLIQGYQNSGIKWIAFNHGPNGAFGQPIELIQIGYWWHMENDARFKVRDERLAQARP